MSDTPESWCLWWKKRLQELFWPVRGDERRRHPKRLQVVNPELLAGLWRLAEARSGNLGEDLVVREGVLEFCRIPVVPRDQS